MPEGALRPTGKSAIPSGRAPANSFHDCDIVRNVEYEVVIREFPMKSDGVLADR